MSIEEPKSKKRKTSSRLSKAHPLGVKPSGNALVAADGGRAAKELRAKGLGNLNVFSDEILITILADLGNPTDLLNLSHSSRFLYAFGFFDELWKTVFVSMKGTSTRGPDRWLGTWRRTLLNISEDEDKPISCHGMIYSDALYRSFQCSQINFADHLDLSGTAAPPETQIPRVSYDMSSDDFKNHWSDKPFILSTDKHNCSEDKLPRWPSWTSDNINERFGDVVFRQECVDWRYSTYKQYMEHNSDESPLYLFDCGSQAIKTLTSEYTVPAIFQQDLFSVCSTAPSFRPDHRWIIIGSERSGSTFHKDPNATCAWNAVIQGEKYWMLFPPNGIASPPGVHTDDNESEVTAPCSIAEWVLGGFYREAIEMAKDETMYVPAGWWHLVINSNQGDNIAITQNFIPEGKQFAHALDFIKNKPDQISGFKDQRIKDALTAQELMSNYSKTRPEPQNIHNQGIELEYGDDDGLCMNDKVFDLFINRLRDSAYKDQVDSALEIVAKFERERVLKGQKLAALEHEKSSKWEELTNESEAGFSFGFGFAVDEEAENNICIN
ncbi:Clavaminate synthase-like protein [Nadsonia fulvescens var. elongata DSM 6958]|uniref:Clavaminate synthase-like protein n=1 Tax=Nadsonia fulvescens var. elongata DSM 6958 TaxID=857566 RepID=A0A1E3PQ30_9ASCO|nr:Clavaminate synthase-like protein [Nadsonia fulvescens var. elongata DSM 6958]